MATEIVTTAASMEIKAVAARKDEYIITILSVFSENQALSILPESVFATAITTAAAIQASTHHHLS